MVSDVEVGSPAAKAGLQRGDIVTQVAGVQVEDADDFRVRMKSYPAKTPIKLSLIRGGQPVEVSLTPVEFPARLADTLAWDRLGLRVKAQAEGLVITAVRPNTSAARIGLAPGDVVLKLNNQPLPSVDRFRESLISARMSRSVLLLVRRGRVGYHVTLPM